MSDEILKLLAETQSQQLELLKQLKENGMHEKVPATQNTATRLHGANGIFTGPGLERDVITAHIRPRGISTVLPWLPSISEAPLFAALTGYTATTGSEVTNACDDAPNGYVKACNLTARFGLVRRDTKTIEMDKVMLTINRGDFTDLVLRGQVLGLTNLVPSGLNQGQILDIITMSEMVIAGVNMERRLSTLTWQGSFLVRNEFPGLDSQIATGQMDADTGTLCPALDSDVKDYNYQHLSSTLVNYLSMLEWYLKYNADAMGLDPVNWIIVMRPEVWFELTAIWPCAYNTVRCSSGLGGGTNDNSTALVLNGTEMTAERDAMRNGMYIWINGTKYPVVIDTGIYEKNSTNTAGIKAGEFASSIYMIPLTITGGFPVTYFEYIDYRRATSNISLLNGVEEFFWTDDGRFSWAVEQIKWCYKLALKIEPRIILRTPQLAGRIDNVLIEPLQHLRDSDPSSVYHKDGGVSLRSGLADPWAVWNSRQ